MIVLLFCSIVRSVLLHRTENRTNNRTSRINFLLFGPNNRPNKPNNREGGKGIGETL